MNAVERLGLAVAVPILVGGAFFTQLRGAQPHRPEMAVAGDRVLVADPRQAGDERHDANDAHGVMDMYGNVVTDAVATYTFDQAGSQYELHSPQTELPHLGSPKS